MKKYGLKIGDIGIEFPSVEDRQKALNFFTKGTDVKISPRGVRYSDGEGSFSVYDRDTKEVITTCEVCVGTFLIETCSRREYPDKYSYNEKYHTADGFICDACFAKKNKDKELFEARQKLEAAGEEE